MSANTVEVSYTLGPDEIDVVATCLVTPGTPDRGPDMNCAGGYPGDPPEVEILTIEDADGRELTIEVSQGDLDRISEAAFLQAAEAERDAEDLRADDECDRRRDETYRQERTASFCD